MSLTQLSQLLPLPEEELQQVLDYAATLPKAEAVSHFTNLLGDSPQAIEFISSFNGRRQGPCSSSAAQASSSSTSSAYNAPHDDGVPRPKRGGKKKATKAALHTPEARKLDTGFVPSGTAYNKKDADLEYIPQKGASAPTSNQGSRSATPKPPQPSQSKQTTHAGYLISESISKPKPKSNPVSRTSTPKPFSSSSGNTKVSITGGTPMAGASAAIADLDAAIRALEITTNPTLDDPASRRCDCVATRHPLQTAAPNCLSCGKVICVKEGLGPCTFCGTPLLSSQEVQGMVRELKEERGRERMAADAEAHRRPAVSKTPAPFTKPRDADPGAGSSSTLSEAEAKARQHRDKLLNFQAQNARRTTVRDEAADFDVTRGGSMWATPEERAKELKQQQKLMREMEWNARPEYEKRRQVVSIDLVGGKVVRRMAAVERPASPDEEDIADDDATMEGRHYDVLKEVTGNSASTSQKPRGGGAFSGNPLLGTLIKPTFEARGKDKDKGKEKETQGRPTKKGWRRVQDDLDNNEAVILDGGTRGHSSDDHES